MVDLFRYRKWDLVSKRWIYFTISFILLGIGIVSLVTRGLNLGIDFQGGGLVTYRVEGNLPVTQGPRIIGDIRGKLEEADINAEVQISPGMTAGAEDQILVRTLLTDVENPDALLSSQIEETITPAVENVTAEYGGQAVTLDGQEVVTGVISAELINNGLMAIVLGSLLIMGWIWLRYNIGGAGLKYSVAAVIALLHDVLFLIGMFALLREYLQVNSPFIAALLTVLGYSIHDTIIIFDRVRENIRLRKGRTFAETVNISLLETMARSVNTTVTVLFTLLALFFFGGPTLRDFTAAMTIGMFIGTYSSIFIASQILVSWAKGKDKEMLPLEGVTDSAAAPSPAVSAAAPEAVVAGVAAPSQQRVDSSQNSSREAIRKARQAGRKGNRK